MSCERLEDRPSRRFEDMSSKRLEEVFSLTIFRLPRRFSRRLQDVLEDEKLLRWRRFEDQQMFAGRLETLNQQKQPMGIVCKTSCSKKFCKFR